MRLHTIVALTDFSPAAEHALERAALLAGAHGAQLRILFAADGPLELVSQVSSRFGRQPPLPDWAIGGAIVGLKDGLRSFEFTQALGLGLEHREPLHGSQLHEDRPIASLPAQAFVDAASPDAHRWRVVKAQSRRLAERGFERCRV